MDRDVVVIPAETDQIVGVGVASVGPRLDMVDFEPVSAGTAFHGASTISVEDMTTQFAAHGAGASSQIQGFAALGDPDQSDPPLTEDLFEGSWSDPGSAQGPDSGLPIVFPAVLVSTITATSTDPESSEGPV